MAALTTTDAYTRFAERHWRLLATCMCVGLLTGFGWSLLQPSRYSATTSVVLSPVPSYVSASTSGRLPPEVTIDTDAQLVRTPEVLGAVATAAEQEVSAVPEHLLVTAVPLSRVLQITFTADTPRAAARGAAAAAGAFIDIRQDALGALQEDQLRRLGLRIVELQQRLDAREQRKPVILTEDSLALEIAELRARLVELEGTRAAPASISQRAALPASRDATNAEVPLTSGAMLGLLAGCGIGSRRTRCPTNDRPSAVLTPASGDTVDHRRR